MLCMVASAWSYETKSVTITCGGTNSSPFMVSAITSSYGQEGEQCWEVRNSSTLKLKANQSYYVTRVEFVVNGDNVENCDKLQYNTPRSWVRGSDDTAYYDVITFSNEEGFSKVTSITVTYYHVCYAKAYHEATPGTCSKNGLNEYWECACGRMFSDADCTNEATKASLSSPIDPTNHDGNLQEVAFKNASVAENGVYHHWHCEACGNDYADADATENMNGKTAKAKYDADALLIGNTTVDESYLFDGAKVTFDGDQVNLTIGSDVHEYALSETERLAIDFSHTFQLKANQDPNHKENFYSTFYTGEGAYKVPETAKAYAGKVETGEETDVLKLADVGNIIHKSEAVILKATGSDITLMPSCNKTVASIENVLEGTDEATTLSANQYALSLGQNGVGFYLWEGKSIGANKAYLTLTASAGAKALTFQFDNGETTGIQEASPTSSPEGKDLMYNLNGVRVNDHHKGIVIKNGKKIYQK